MSQDRDTQMRKLLPCRHYLAEGIPDVRLDVGGLDLLATPLLSADYAAVLGV